MSVVIPRGVIPLFFLFILNVDGAIKADHLIYVGCSKEKLDPDSPFQGSLNSLLTSVLDSASQTTYKSFAVGNDSSSSSAAAYGLYQCRGDLETEECSSCIGSAVSRMRQSCSDSIAGLLQMEGCYVRYQQTDFLGRLDTALMFKKCSKSVMEDEEFVRGRDEVLAGLEGDGDGGYRVKSSGLVEGTAQCVGDLSSSDCSTCLAEAVGKLKTVCGSSSAASGVFLSKCYARYSLSGYDDDQNSSGGLGGGKCSLEEIVAVGIGALALLFFLVVIVLCLRNRLCSKEDVDGERAHLPAAAAPHG